MDHRGVFDELTVLRYKYRTTIVLVFCFVSIFASGPLGLLSAATAQEEVDPMPEDNSDSMLCEPMMSNVTIPSAAEDVLPPEMYLVYEDRVYKGELSQSKYREGETFSDLNIQPENIGAELPDDAVEIKNDTCAQFIVKGTPRTLPPDSLDISAYTIDGTAVGVLNATEDNTNTFRINLPTGSYILLASATWIPSAADEFVTGYVIYKFLANVA